MKTRKFWPLDFDPEGEIYENVSWDLPGYKGTGSKRAQPIHPAFSRRPAQKRRRA